MSETQVFHMRTWTGAPDEVYCGRPGKGQANAIFGNPVAVGRRCVYCSVFHAAAGDTLPCFTKYLDKRLEEDGEFRLAVRNLDGKKLFCFCITPGNPTAPCHCFILADRAKKLNQGKTLVRKPPNDHNVD